MRLSLALLALWPLLLQDACDPAALRRGAQDKVRQRAETALRPYFPRISAELDSNNRLLTAYTCVTNLGPQSLEAFAGVLEKNSDYQSLRKYHSAAGISTFVLGFDQQLIRFDLESGKHTIEPVASLATYSKSSTSHCAAPPPTPDI